MGRAVFVFAFVSFLWAKVPGILSLKACTPILTFLQGQELRFVPLGWNCSCVRRWLCIPCVILFLEMFAVCAGEFTGGICLNSSGIPFKMWVSLDFSAQLGEVRVLLGWNLLPGRALRACLSLRGLSALLRSLFGCWFLFDYGKYLVWCF